MSSKEEEDHSGEAGGMNGAMDAAADSNTEELEWAKTKQCIAGICGMCIGFICAVGLVGGSFAVFVFTCVFLDKDKDKGGSDPTCLDAGDAIWVYVLVRLLVGCCGGVAGTGFSKNEVGAKTYAMDPRVSGVTTLLSVIYGGVVLFSKDVCDQYKNTGLYKMYCVMYWIDVSTLSIIVLYLGYGPLAARFAEVEQNISADTQGIKSADVPLTDDAVVLTEESGPDNE